MSSNEQLTPPVQLYGLPIAWGSNTTLTVGTGNTLDALQNNNMTVSSTITINSAVNGANGLDTGTIAASTFYAVYLIGSSLLNPRAPTAALLSTNYTTPTMPQYYDIYIRIGFWVTDSMSHFVLMTQFGTGRQRTYIYDTLPQALNAGTQTSTFAAIDFTGFLPIAAIQTTLNYFFTANSAGDAALFRPTGSTSSVGTTISSPAASHALDGQVILFTGVASGKPEIDYKLSSGSDSLSLYVYSFLDNI